MRINETQKKPAIFSILLLLLITATNSVAQTGTIPPTGSAETCVTIRGNRTDGKFKHAHLSDLHPTAADTSQPEIVSASWTCGGPSCNFRAAIRYELNNIPADAVIISAKLYLYAKLNALTGIPGSPTSGPSNTSLLQKITTPWSLATISWNNPPSVTTSGQAVLPQSTSTTQNYVVDVKNIVQDWVTNPSSNFGWLLRLQSETAYNSMVFHSGSTTDSTLQPRLEICYVRVITPPGFCVNIRGNRTDGKFKHAHLSDLHPTAADTSQPEIVSASWTCGGPSCNFRAAIRYELNNIPADALIVSAKLYLFAKLNALTGIPGSPTSGPANTSLLQKITSPWSLATVSWNNPPVVTTTGQAVLPQSTGTAQNYIVDVKNAVQEWVTNPSSNYGWLLRLQTENAYNSMIFHSGSTTDSTLQPRLEICYIRVSSPPPLCTSIRGNRTDGKFKHGHLSDLHPAAADTSQPEIVAASWTCGGSPCNFRAVLRYELNNIPSNATVISAKIYLYAKLNALTGIVGSPTSGSANTSLLQRITSPWSLATVSWNNPPVVTTTGQVVLPQSTSNAQNYIVDVKTAVQGWVTNPSSNHGWLLRLQTENAYNSMIFHSGSTADSTLRPRLEICYYLPPTGVFRTSVGGTGSHRVSAYPNPTRGMLNLDIQAEYNDIAEVSLIDWQNNQVVYRSSPSLLTKGDNHLSFEVNRNLSPNRYYMVRIRFRNHEKTIKIFLTN